MTTSDVTPGEALRSVRNAFHASATPFEPRHCLQAVRTPYGIPSKYLTAREAREHAKTFHKYNGNPESIPYGAFVFSRRKGSTGTAEHVFLAGGHSHRKRIFWTVDAKILGGWSPVHITFFIERWGHEILGWSLDINEVGIDAVIPKVNTRKSAPAKTAKKSVPRKRTTAKTAKTSQETPKK